MPDKDSDWYCDDDLLLDELRDGLWPTYHAPRIGGYRDFRELRRGGQGVVYRALQESTGRPVALKVLHDSAWSSPRNRQRFEREIALAATFQHPHVVRLYDSGVTDQGQPYYVMEFIDGIGLDEYLETLWNPPADEPERKRSPHETLRMFVKICDGVQAAHQRSFVHRDIKPSNIRIDRDGEPHVLDFGLAKRLPDGVEQGSSAAVSLTGDFLGSLPWASPEQTAGHPDQVDARADVYALGIVLYQLLTGEFPYPVTGGLADVVDRIRTAEPRRPSAVCGDLDDELDAIVLKCLDKETVRRYPNAGALGRDIRHYLDGEPIEAKRESFGYRLRKRAARHRLQIASVLALVILGMIAVRGLWSPAAPTLTSDLPAGLSALVDRVGDTEHGRTFFANALHASGGQVTIPANLAIGHDLEPGALSVAARETVEVDGALYVGYDAYGLLEVTAGGYFQSEGSSVGHLSGSSGEVVVRGAASTWTDPQTVCVGNAGEGTLQILEGGQVFALASRIARQASGVGVVTITGGGSKWHAGLDLDVGSLGRGTLVVRDGGQALSLHGHVGIEPTAVGDVTISGDGAMWVTRGSLYLGGGVGVSGGYGDLRLTGHGQLFVHHMLKIWTNGRLMLDGGILCADTIEHTAGGELAFYEGGLYVNTYRGDLVIEGGTLAPAHSPGTINVTGDYAQPAGALELRLREVYVDEHDALVVTGTASLGGTLRVIRGDDCAPQHDDKILLVTANLIDGAFNDGETSLDLVNGGSCEVVYGNSEVFLTHFEGPFEQDANWTDPHPDGPLPKPNLPEGPFPRYLSQNTTGEHDLTFLGPPDNIHVGLAGQIVECDFGELRVVDGEGMDFNVYESDIGTSEHGTYDVLVSLDGVNFVSVKANWAPVVRIPGDESLDSDLHAVSYDLAGSGLSRVRYIRIDGVGDGSTQGYKGFDLDALGAIHFEYAE
jgi:T5SS/PEP-CTERM-associated repeat protein